VASLQELGLSERDIPLDEFRKYEALRDAGSKPRDVYEAARSYGLDLITTTRLLRKVFGLSLADAKRVCAVPDPFFAKQELVPGATVYWEGWSSEEGFYLMEARVTEVVDGTVRVDGHKKYRVTETGFETVACDGMQMRSVPIHYFEKPLSERFAESLQWLQDLPKALSVNKAV
jgi:hypothetical protein